MECSTNIEILLISDILSSSIFLLTFCLIVLSVVEREVLKFPTIIVDLFLISVLSEFTSHIFQLKVNGWKIICHVNVNERRAGMAMSISVKVDFKINKITKSTRRHYVIIKGSIHQ